MTEHSICKFTPRQGAKGCYSTSSLGVHSKVHGIIHGSPELEVIKCPSIWQRETETAQCLCVECCSAMRTRYYIITWINPKTIC